MDKLVIVGGTPLRGEIPVSGAKNAALPLIAAGLLPDGRLTLHNTPQLADIRTMSWMLSELGVAAVRRNGSIEIEAREISSVVAPYDLVRKMRASILVLGPLLARMGRARVSLPGGCAIGTRPVDLHLMAMEKLGATIELEGGYVIASAPNGLQGGRIRFPFVSVGATENALMAAALAKGTTVIENAAREPEVVDLARCLTAMGAQIEGTGTARLTIEGVDALSGTDHDVVPDRIEAGTYAIATVATAGDVLLRRARAEDLGALLAVLERMDVEVAEEPGGLRVRRRNGVVHGVDVETQPFPGFPTDLQAQMMALLALAEGASAVHETIFENRFMHVPELMRMGADITLKGNVAVVRGVKKLTGAPVMATDLRASFSLVLAALAAEGETIVNRVYHLDRGYERVEDKLRACGASIERLAD